jgi:hypothetical protein
VVAFEADVPSAGEYYMLTHESRVDNSAVRKFRKWVLLMADAKRMAPADGTGQNSG